MSATVLNFIDRDLFDSETFLIDGTFNVPLRVDKAFVLAAGAGGGGGAAASPQAGNGGAGAVPELITVPVTPGAAITIDVGTGGAGGVGSGDNDGADGGDTTFGPHKFLGAPGGTSNLNGPNPTDNYRPAGSFSRGGLIGTTAAANAGQDTHHGLNGGDPGGTGSRGGSGGGGLGNGGVGGQSVGGGNASPGDGGTSAGGGGVGAGQTVDGADGGDGFVTVYWFKIDF